MELFHSHCRKPLCLELSRLGIVSIPAWKEQSFQIVYGFVVKNLLLCSHSFSKKKQNKKHFNVLL